MKTLENGGGIKRGYGREIFHGSLKSALSVVEGQLVDVLRLRSA
jgi:hypothetical protein